MKASGRRYDIIYMGDVLEHLPAPAATLRDLDGLLAPGGLFFVEGPLEDNVSLVYYSARLFGLPSEMIYLFVAWLGMVGGTAWFAYRLPNEPGQEKAEDLE